MKTIQKLFAVLVLLLAGAGMSQAQTALTQTTLSQAVNGPQVYSGLTAALDTSVTLASVTGVVAPFNTSVIQSALYVGLEEMGVTGVNTTTKVVTVVRGYNGTKASPHPTGDMVLVGQFNVLGANMFFQQDPPLNGACTAANTPSTPWVNVLTGAQWLCSTITGTWVPGWNNPLVPEAAKVTAAVASASTILPTGPLFHLTGATSVVTITQPVGCNATAVGGCQFTAICDGVCTWSAAGNIATAAGTVVAGTAITFTWDATNSKWYPNVVT